MWIWSKLAPAKWRDAWEERFHALENTSLVITELAGKKTIRLEMYCQHKQDAEAARRQFGGTVRQLKQRNWAAMATPRITPIKIRDRFLIVSDTSKKALAEHRKAHPGRDILSIPVEMAFGTGDHPTTSTCLRWMCDLNLQGRRVLDLGCGTGILAIAAKKLGAAEVVAVDFDPAAVAVAKANAPRNGVEGIVFEQQDVLKWTPPGTYDLILANIFADVLTAAFPKMKSCLAPEGRVILSGILHTSATEVRREGEECGFVFTRDVQRGRWVTLEAQRPSAS